MQDLIVHEKVIKFLIIIKWIREKGFRIDYRSASVLLILLMLITVNLKQKINRERDTVMHAY